MLILTIIAESNCGGTYIGGQGYITSPGYPNGYAHNLDCVYLVARPGDTVEVSFLSFETENNYDYVAVYGGKYMNTEGRISAGWEGHVLPVTPWKAKDYLWLHFITNGNNISDPRFHKGWRAIYRKYLPYIQAKKK